MLMFLQWPYNSICRSKPQTSTHTGEMSRKLGRRTDSRACTWHLRRRRTTRQGSQIKGRTQGREPPHTIFNTWQHIPPLKIFKHALRLHFYYVRVMNSQRDYKCWLLEMKRIDNRIRIIFTPLNPSSFLQISLRFCKIRAQTWWNWPRSFKN